MKGTVSKVKGSKLLPYKERTGKGKQARRLRKIKRRRDNKKRLPDG